MIKTKKKILFTLFSLLIVLTGFNFKQTNDRPLIVESNHSTVQFVVPISNGMTRVTGKFNDYSIDINYNDDDFTKSTFNVKIKVESIDTGIDARDEHLRTTDFFDVEKFPEITFVSNKIIAQDHHYMITGIFTMHGVSKTITFPIKITGRDGDNTVGFSSRLTLNRIEFGVGSEFKHTSIKDFISDNIQVEIDFWTKKKK